MPASNLESEASKMEMLHYSIMEVSKVIVNRAKSATPSASLENGGRFDLGTSHA